MQTIGTSDFSAEMPLFVIAEIGNNHEGDFARAKDMICAAAENGAHAVKFQFIKPQELVTSDQKDRMSILAKFEFRFEQFAELSEHARRNNVHFFSTPFDIGSVELLDQIQDIFKISSGDNNYQDLITKVGGTGKPTLISTGGLSTTDIQTLHHKFLTAFGDTRNLIFLHCVSLYPTPIQDAQLWRIQWLRRNFPHMAIGYSDHTLGNDACTIAVTLGARVLEKHFTLDKNLSDFRDHKLSADPDELRNLVMRCNETLEYIGHERQNRPDKMDGIRRGAVAAVDIPKGTVVQTTHLKWLRTVIKDAIQSPEGLIGKRVKKSVISGETLKSEMLENK